ncbi:MAG TPA: class I mannose-6-phosphate isomerase [Tepidisphaeraceae bacterium]|nr:class I mannose-6-phosphate isomerase [Tepidisphaeraceae bacterium]
MSLYPLTFTPRFIPKMWGGRRLQTILGKPIPPQDPIGESWEIFDFPPGSVGADGRMPGDDPNGWTSAVVSTGALADRSLHDLLAHDARAILGSARAVQTPHGPQFPLLIKFLDAQQDLSVQVHPPQEYVDAHPEAHLKNECWIVLDAAPGSRLLAGVNEGVTPEQFRKSLDDGTCEALLRALPVSAGQTIYLPSGTVHALGAGVLAAEVQTPSDTTFRVFDFNRVDPKSGRPRDLHVEPAMQCIDFTSPPPTLVPAGETDARIVTAPQFVVDRVVRHEYDETRYDAGQMRVLIVLSGSARLLGSGSDIPIRAGQTVLLPADVHTVLVPAPYGICR